MLLSGPPCGLGWAGEAVLRRMLPGSWDPCWRPLAGRLWLRGEYILWWTRRLFFHWLDILDSQHAAGTTTLFGGTAVSNWLAFRHPRHRRLLARRRPPVRLVGTYFVQGSISESFQGQARACSPSLSGRRDRRVGLPLASPGVRTGARFPPGDERVRGAEFLLRRNLFQRCQRHFALSYDYRYV